MSDLLRALLPWILVPGVAIMVPAVVLRARWGSRNTRFVKVLVSAALMMTLTVPAIGGILDAQSGLLGVQTLVCDSIAIYMSRQAALGIWESSGASAGDATINRILTVLSILGVVVLVAAYIAIHQSGANLLRLDTSSLQPGPLTFWVTFCLVHGTNMTFALARSIQMRWGRPLKRRDRRSLTWWVVSCLAIWAYILNFPIALALIAAGRDDHFVVANTQLLQALPGLVGCIAGATCAALWADIGSRVQHALLRPAWAWSTRTERDVVLLPFMHTPGHRLSRRRTEIALAVDRLISSTTHRERAQVAQVARRGSLPAHEHWGLLLHAGRRARLRGQPPRALPLDEVLPQGPTSWWRLQMVIWRGRRYQRLQAQPLRPLPEF